MREEVKRWFEKAESDLRKAKDNFKLKNYDLSSFLSQQAVEKALKALQIKKEREFSKTHDLLFLAKKLQISPDLIEKCDKLNPVYIETRYPDANGKFETYSERESKEDIEIAEEVLLWIRKNL